MGCQGLARLLLCLLCGSLYGRQTTQETVMSTRISSKLAALAIALMLNSVIIGGVAYVFEAQTEQNLSVFTFAKQMAAFQWVI
jgi:hypothetical protein